MLSETMQKKLTNHFHFQDLDQDGFVERADWEKCAQNLAAIRNWEPGSPEYDDIVAKHVQIWTNSWEPADLDEDGQVSLDEYLQLADKQRKHSGVALDLIYDLFGAIFDIIDLDGDGKITVEDYRHYFEAWGLEKDLAEQAFTHLDLSGDGRLSRSIFIQFGSNYFMNDEPNVPGNWLFGPLE